MLGSLCVCLSQGGPQSRTGPGGSFRQIPPDKQENERIYECVCLCTWVVGEFVSV